MRWPGRVGLALAPVATAVAIFVGIGRFEQAESRRQADVERAVAASRRAVFARGQLGEMLALCSEGWASDFSHEPSALAWTREGVDAYFLQGSDTSSLRQLRCGADGVTRGPRVEHPLARFLPAEAPATSAEADLAEWRRAFDRAVSRALDADEAAFELLRHPVTGAVFARTWRARPEGAEAVLDPPDAPAFALLVTAGGFAPAGAAVAAAPRPLRRFRWTVETDAAFDLVARALPGQARISELRLEPDGIDVRIEWPTPAFDGDPPAPYGDKAFDEYGVAELAWWYPRTDATFGCAAGAPLAAVRSAFAEAAARLGGQPLAWAWYSCSSAYSDGRTGVWHLVPASR